MSQLLHCQGYCRNAFSKLNDILDNIYVQLEFCVFTQYIYNDITYRQVLRIV